MTDITAARQRAETVLERMTQDKGPADCAWWAEAAWDLALAVIRLDDALHGVPWAEAGNRICEQCGKPRGATPIERVSRTGTGWHCACGWWTWITRSSRAASLPGEGSEASP